jgi:hypothetical protein
MRRIIVLLNLAKPVQTVSGHKARIISTDISGDFPIAVAVCESDGREFVVLCDENGIAANPSGLNIRNIITKKTGWIHLWAPIDCFGTKETNMVALCSDVYETKEAAEKCVAFTTSLDIATLKIEWEA